MTPILKQLVDLSALPLKGVETDFAVDSTGIHHLPIRPLV